MKDYSLSAEHDGHFEISHPKEGIFKVAKNRLDEKTIKKIRGLPKGLAEGGEVGDKADVPAQPPQADYAPVSGGIPSMPAPSPGVPAWAVGSSAAQAPGYAVPGQAALPPDMALPEATPASPAEEASAAPANPNTAPFQGGMQTTSATAPMESPFDALSKQNEEAMAGAKKGIEESRQAQQQMAADAAKAQQDYIAKINEAAAKRDKSLAQNEVEHNQIVQSIKDQKIDPNRVWSNAGTGNSIMAAIGVMLSGVGSGLAGGPNLALDSINKAIDRDIEAQRAELGKKETLLSDNIRKYGNINTAYEATSMQLHSVVQAQIQMAAAKSQSMQAKATADTAIAQLDMQRNNFKMQVAQAQGNSALGMALGEGKFASTKINPEDPRLAPYRDRMVSTGKGGYVLARTKEDAKEVQKALTGLDKIDASLDEMLRLSKENGVTVPGSTANAKAAAARNSLILELNALHGINRLNEKEIEIHEKTAPDPGSLRQDKAVAQIMQLKRFTQEKRNAEYQNNVEGFSPGEAAGKVTPVKAVLTGG